MIRCVLLLCLLLTGCDPGRVAFRPVVPPPTSGYWQSETGEWLAVAENGVVNVACRMRCELPFTSGGACGLREQVSDTYSIAYRGGFVTPDSAAGTLVSTHGLRPEFTAAGAFTAVRVGDGWHVVAWTTMTDSCRVSPPSTVTFDAYQEVQ